MERGQGLSGTCGDLSRRLCSEQLHSLLIKEGIFRSASHRLVHEHGTVRFEVRRGGLGRSAQIGSRLSVVWLGGVYGCSSRG